MGDLEDGRDCFERGAWRKAYEALTSADRAAPLDVEDLDRLANAAYLSGRDLDYRRTLQRLYGTYVASGSRAGAARCAFWLSLIFALRGETGQANAWSMRGQRLVGDIDCVERGYLAVAAAEQLLEEGQAEAAQVTGGEAAAIGEAFGDPDLTAAARHVQGRALILQGEVVAGLKRLDETMLAVVANELSPVMTARMYCSVIDTCRQVYALGRAREWTAAFSSLCEQQPEMVFSGTCLVHRAEILQLQGAWPDALSEACRACERAHLFGRKPSGAALYQRAEIHRLRGEFAQAEAAYCAASEMGCEPHPGLALLRLAQGRTDAACAAIRRLTSTTGDRLRRARLLPAHLEIMLAIGDVEDARVTCDELRNLAQAFDSEVLRAVAAQGDGAIALADGRAQEALDPLRLALERWERLDAPYEAARVRVAIGDACRALGDDEAAALEHKAARVVFERLGAKPDLADVDGPRRGVQPGSPSPLTERERGVLRLISTGRTNKEIAAELCLSERTIDRHVSNILDKLDVPSRAAATAYAFRHKLL